VKIFSVTIDEVLPIRSSITLKNQVMGCLLGGALGDAWGGPSEGTGAPEPFQIPERTILSDDTELTLATCESIIELGRVDPEHIASHISRRFLAGRVHGMGSSTLKAMRDLAVGTHWALAGARGEYAAGNGAAMRIAPLAFLVNPSISRDRVLVRDVCRITHHSDEAYVGALAVLLAIQSVLSGVWSIEASWPLRSIACRTRVFATASKHCCHCDFQHQKSRVVSVPPVMW
jgi:ADP-ribosyl-[dinitrogen reductase] hydrolase